MGRLLGVVLVSVVVIAQGGCGAEAEPAVGVMCDGDADCAALDDGNPCNGAMVCTSGSCRLSMAAVPTCDASGDTACAANTCQPADGSCKLTPRAEGLVCDDGDPCTLGDRCSAGACAAGKADVCACRADADCPDDGDLCNGTPTCDTGSFPHRCVVKPGSAVACKDDGDPCTAETCDPKTGKCGSAPVADGAACNDDDPCTGGETCTAGKCGGGKSTCGCTEDKDCADVDGDPCTGISYCDKSGGKGTCKPNPATVVTCSTAADTDCTKNQCDPKTGKCAFGPVKDGGACDDGNACTTGEICVGGSCAAGTDTCKCTKDSDCKDADDGDLCNGTPFCNQQSGKCETNPATVVNCPTVDDTACLKNVCQPKTGACAKLAREDVRLVGCVEVDLGGLIGKQCLWKPSPTKAKGPFACDDGSPCTTGETCKGKTCTGGKQTCECSKDSDCLGKDDGDLCNGVLFCDVAVGKCKSNPASVVYCSKKDDTACEKAACDPKTGACSLKPTAKGGACDDGKPCTLADACDGKGGCAGAKANPCDDKNPCTTDSCDPKSGCVHKAKSCDDGNDCTTDTCNKTTGQCSQVAKKEGFVCNADNDGCTVADACVKGVCKVGKPMACSGQVAACQQLVCVSKGPDSGVCSAVAKPDATPCPDDPKSCHVGAQCTKGVCVPGKRSRVFSKLLGDAKGYAWFADVAAHPDGSLIAVGGRRTTPSSDKSTRWLVSSYDPTGKLVWSKEPHGSYSSALCHAREVTTVASGQIWVAGVTSPGASHGRIVRYDNTGLAVGIVTVHKTGTNDFRGLEAIPSGGAVAALTWDKSASSSCQKVVRLSTSGKVLWEQTSFCKPGLRTVDLAVQGNVMMELNQYLVGNKSDRSFAARSLTNGASLHAQSPSGLGEDALAVASAGSEGFTLAWTVGGQTQMRRVGLDGLFRFKLPPLDKQMRVESIAFRSGVGGAVMAGRAGKTGFVGALDAFGNRLWHTTPSLNGDGPLLAAVPVGQDVVAAGYQDLAGGVRRPWLVRTSPFGAVGCSAIGACAGKSVADCDDGKACTRDACNGKTGCIHDIPLVAKCDPKDGCSRVGNCSLGICQSANEGQRFNESSPWSTTANSGADAVMALAGGGARIWGVKGASIYSSDWDAWASQSPPDYATLCKGFANVRHVLPRFDGSVVVTGESKQSSPSSLGRYCVVDPNGKPKTSNAVLIDTGCSSCWSAARWADQGLDGSTFMVGSWRKPYTNVFFGVVQKLDASDKAAWSVSLSADHSIGVHAVKALPDGGAAVVGRIHANKKGTPNTGVRYGLIAAVSHDGKQRFLTTVKHGTDDIFQAAALLKSSTLLAAGRSTINTSAHALFLAGLDPKDGKVLWKHVSTPADLAGAVDAVPEPTGGAVIAGDITLYGQKRVFIDRIDDKGARVWRRTYLLNGSYYGQARSLTAWSGGYLLGTRSWTNKSGPSSSDRPVLIKTDKGGFAGCKEAGTCISKTPADCDDKNPCTADWCDPKSGCQHHKVAGCK